MRLVDQLIREGKMDKAKAAMNFILAKMPDKTIPYDQISANYVGFLLTLGETQKGLEIANIMATRAESILKYNIQHHTNQDSNIQLYIIQTLANACREGKQDAAAKKYEALLQQYMTALGG